MKLIIYTYENFLLFFFLLFFVFFLNPIEIGGQETQIQNV